MNKPLFRVGASRECYRLHCEADDSILNFGVYTSSWSCLMFSLDHPLSASLCLPCKGEEYEGKNVNVRYI